MTHIHQDIDFVVAAYIVYQKSVLLIHHKQLDSWLPIGGHIELNENPQQALFREIKEESGLTKASLISLSTKPKKKFPQAKLLLPPTFLDIHKITMAHQHIGLTYFFRSKTNQVALAGREHHHINWFNKQQLGSLNLKSNVHFYSLQALKLTKDLVSS